MSVKLPESELPQEPEYWARLQRQIHADACAPLAAYAATPLVWYGVLARSASWLVAASAAAMVILWLWLPAVEPSPALQWIENSLEPNEIAGTLVGGHSPPSVEVLMVQFSPDFEEGGRQ